MTAIQVVLGVAFLAALVGVYWKQVAAAFGRTVRFRAGPKASIAVELVDDILSVTQLRDKLAAEGYQEGVDACTVLLRVIVEHNHATQGVV